MGVLCDVYEFCYCRINCHCLTPHMHTHVHHYISVHMHTLLILALTYPPDGSLRLSGYGSSALAGRLEVYLGGNWSAVCSTGFDYQAATVACKQMGLGSAVNYGSYPSNRYMCMCGRYCMCVYTACMYV